MAVLDRDAALTDLLLAVISHWLTGEAGHDIFIAQSLVEMLDLLVYSRAFWTRFKASPQGLADFIKLQKRPDMTAATRSKALKIIKALSLPRHEQLPAPPSHLMQDRRALAIGLDHVGPTGALQQQSQLMPIYDL